MHIPFQFHSTQVKRISRILESIPSGHSEDHKKGNELWKNILYFMRKFWFWIPRIIQTRLGRKALCKDGYLFEKHIIEYIVCSSRKLKTIFLRINLVSFFLSICRGSKCKKWWRKLGKDTNVKYELVCEITSNFTVWVFRLL